MAFRCGQKHIDDENISKNIIPKLKIKKLHQKSAGAVKNVSRENKKTRVENDRTLALSCQYGEFDVLAGQTKCVKQKMLRFNTGTERVGIET